jgi:Helix-turn-helix domain
VWVHGLATFAGDVGDEAARRLAAVQLVRLRAASQRQVAAAFGTDSVTVWRWDSALREQGVAGLVSPGVRAGGEHRGHLVRNAARSRYGRDVIQLHVRHCPAAALCSRPRPVP